MAGLQQGANLKSDARTVLSNVVRHTVEPFMSGKKLKWMLFEVLNGKFRVIHVSNLYMKPLCMH